MSEFHLTTSAQTIFFGPGSVARLGDVVARAGWRRVMLCATPNFRGRGHLAPIEAALGERLAVTFEDVQPHVPALQVADAVALADQYQVDAVIGVGGGSAIGTAKAVSAALRSDQPDQGSESLVPVIAIPTTYAGSEMTPVFGVTERENGATRKVTRSDPGVTPRIVVYDPLLTLDLPPRITAGTGINAVAHCVEALYSTTRNPLASAVAAGGLRAICHALLRCYFHGDDLAARDEMLSGAFLAGTALSHVTMGLHHGVCHVIGGATGVAHGDANSIMLPHVMRFKPEVIAPQLAEAAVAMGIPAAGQSDEALASSAARQVSDWVAAMQLPSRLRDLGIQERRLHELAQMAFASRTVQSDPRPIGDVAEIETLFREAW